MNFEKSLTRKKKIILLQNDYKLRYEVELLINRQMLFQMNHQQTQHPLKILDHVQESKKIQ